MDDIPSHISLVFLATTLATIGFVYFGIRASEKKKKHLYSGLFLLGSLVWLGFLSLLANSDFFLSFDTMPPRIMVAILPLNLLTLTFLIIKKTRTFLLKIPATILTYIHIIRVPVEMVLWWLALTGAVPFLLTFEGINYDILSGVTAPFVAIFLVGKKRNNKVGAIIWNLATLGLLFNIVGHAILSTPYPFQQFSIDQPLTAVFYWPYIWLPGFVVPAVFFAHLVTLVKLFGKPKDQ